MKFNRAITRKPPTSYLHGITTSDLGQPNLEIALQQHAAYCQALQQAGLTLEVLPPLEKYPDSVFVEDVAIVEPNFAVQTRPGALSRRGEAEEITTILRGNFPKHYQIEKPGTLDGGDICKVDQTYYIGISDRTNLEGAQQLSTIFNYFGYSSELIDIRKLDGVLHLKSAVNYLGENTLLMDPRIANHPAFASFQRLVVPLEEAYAANCLRVNDVVLVPDGFPQTLELVTNDGFDPKVLDVSEYQKMDGGLSCLSLRW